MHNVALDLTTDQTINISTDTELTGLYIGKGKSSIKTKLKITHAVPNIVSRISIKSVLYDEASFDIEPVVVIEDDAANTDTYLKVDVLLLSDHARARAIPSLEIKHDQVKGGHGATIGHVDAQQLQYLMSRGLSRAQAQELIVKAFIQD